MHTALRGLDDWLTREPYLEPEPFPQPKCSVCGRFVKDEVIHHVTVDEVEECGGDTSGEYGSECGRWHIDHEPHTFVVGGYTVLYRQCVGHVAKEFVI